MPEILRLAGFKAVFAANDRRHLRAGLFMLLMLTSSPALSQINNPAYADYFLVGRFGEVCTMCEVTVLCKTGETAPAPAGIPAEGTFTVYHLQTRTFWSQVATIWEWFVANFSGDALATRGHTRPVHVHAVTDGRWQPMRVVEARLVLDPAVIEFGDRSIDRVERRWITAETNEAIGYCQRLPLWDALEVIERRSTEPDKDNA